MPEAERLRDSLQRLEQELGRPPELADILEREDCPNLPPFQDAFGSWYSALWAVGFTPQNPPSYWEAALESAGYATPVKPVQKWTEDRLLDDLCELADALGRKPKAVDVAHESEMAAPRTYDHVFGSWNTALEEAGFSATPVGKLRRYSDEELITTLQSIAAGLDRQPRTADVVVRYAPEGR